MSRVTRRARRHMLSNIAIILLCSAPGTGGARAQTTLFRDAFDTEVAGVFPKNWELIYSGAGPSFQGLGTAHAASAPNALRLVSASCGVAEAFHPINFPAPVTGADQHVRILALVFVGGVPSGGCNPNAAGLALCNPNFATYGTYYATIYLTESHGITVGPSFDGGPAPVPVAKTYRYATWNKLLIDANLTAKTANYFVDNVPVATGVAFAGLGTPSGICIDSGDSGPNTTAWFDNILVRIPASRGQ